MCSSAVLSVSWLVTRKRTCGAAARTASTNWATESVRCSQLSSTSSSRCDASSDATLRGRLVAGELHAERVGHGRRHERAVAQCGQLDPPDAIGKVGGRFDGDIRRHRLRDARLADAARADDRHDDVLAQQRLDRRQILRAAVKRRQLRGQIRVRARRCRRRGRDGSRAVPEGSAPVRRIGAFDREARTDSRAPEWWRARFVPAPCAAWISAPEGCSPPPPVRARRASASRSSRRAGRLVRRARPAGRTRARRASPAARPRASGARRAAAQSGRNGASGDCAGVGDALLKRRLGSDGGSLAPGGAGGRRATARFRNL